MSNIPICRPILEGKEVEYVFQAIADTDIGSQGRYIEHFEKSFADYIGSRYCVTCTNGTSALHLALLSLGVKGGDEIICPTFTMASPILAIRYCGAKPVLIDTDETWCMDPEKIAKKITKRTKAILAVHIYGHPCDMDKLAEFNLPIIEDSAEAHGSLYKGLKCGSFGNYSCFSFYANKVITTGEGGAILCKTEEDYERLKSLKNLCFGKKNRYLHEGIGYNYRMTNIQAAIGLAQLERIDHYIYLRRKVAKYYTDHLQLPHQPERNWAVSCNWYYGILVPNKLQLMEKLKSAGVETRGFFVGMHKQPFLKSRGKYPMADKLEREGILLPTGNIKEEELKYICDTIRS